MSSTSSPFMFPTMTPTGGGMNGNGFPGAFPHHLNAMNTRNDSENSRSNEKKKKKTTIENPLLLKNPPPLAMNNSMSSTMHLRNDRQPLTPLYGSSDFGNCRPTNFAPSTLHDNNNDNDKNLHNSDDTIPPPPKASLSILSQLRGEPSNIAGTNNQSIYSPPFFSGTTPPSSHTDNGNNANNNTFFASPANGHANGLANGLGGTHSNGGNDDHNIFTNENIDDLSSWVLVYGIATKQQQDDLIRTCESYGRIINRRADASSNWLVIQYQSRLEAEKALCHQPIVIQSLSSAAPAFFGIQRMSPEWKHLLDAPPTADSHHTAATPTASTQEEIASSIFKGGTYTTDKSTSPRAPPSLQIDDRHTLQERDILLMEPPIQPARNSNDPSCCQSLMGRFLGVGRVKAD